MEKLEKLVKKASLGDKSALEEIYKDTYRQVYFTCLAFLKNEQDAADVSQEVYIVVMKSLPTLKDTSRFENWLGKITANKCRDFLKAKRPIPVDDETLSEMVTDEGELLLPEDYVTNDAKRKILYDIMREELSDTLYQAVILFYYQNMSAAEIAELLECPVGTVTSRLCLARAKIKEGVLKYEKKSGDKLYSVALVPVLAKLLHMEAGAIKLPDTNAYAGAEAIAQNIFAEEAVKSGGKVMFATLKAKIIAAVSAAIVAVAGVTTAVVLLVTSSDDNNENAIKPTTGSEVTSEITTENVTDNQEETTENSGATDDPAVEMDYTAMAEDVMGQIEQFFKALISGDVETLVEMSYEGEDCYEDFVEISQYECTSDFIKTLYKDVKYCINEETLSDLAKDLEDKIQDGETSLHVDMEYSKPILFILDKIYPASFNAGEIIPRNPDVNTAEEGIALLEKAMSVMPMMKAPDFWIKLPDKNGDIKVCIDHIIGDIELDKLDQLDELYPARYAYKNLTQATELIAGDVGNGFKEDNDMVVEIDRLLAAKDFTGLESYLSSLSGVDYKAEHEADYGSYEALTDSQKAFVDKFIEEEFNYQLISYSNNNDSNYRNGMLMLTFPVLNDLEHRDIMLTDWYRENDVMEYSIVYPSIADINDYKEFVWRYYTVIDYAAEFVE
ncbi:MAG: sigma-70 family RNA polymerase sigma factor [Lachnospiraceae bacterium]|nr:sigma-70 family RNA polymerase sigma factor [Lachnospiraceae bacterium]